MAEDFAFEELDLPLHAALPWADLGPVEVGSGTCRYCDQPVPLGVVACKDHLGYYIQLRKKVRRQVARLIVLARERRNDG